MRLLHQLRQTDPVETHVRFMSNLPVWRGTPYLPYR